ncbi:Glycosyl transferase family 2 [uncultured Paludibacter sp.]|uniref:Glycosyl transferase family 2 n=1 Tax=uncultured Paludibacter sp. TaxID=497635 RepID=A0A653A4U8_9BACT|nr:Glycosyl transferase family 2 [uncultured Paludibacter sp.]
MLSILIPTYNYNITQLVNELHSQAIESHSDFEIIVMEDGSTLFFDENKIVNELEFCKYIILPKNIGRSAIRNKLADTAKYKYLLFIDCDAEVKDKHFIQRYLDFCKEDAVVIGGTAYDENENNPDFSLRLKYGREREAKNAEYRNKSSELSHFSTFNFLISKNIFNQIRFDETVKGYGHEDTLFGHGIAELGCNIHHIDNSLIHRGLDDNITFIAKTENGTKNLYLMYKSGKYPFLANQSKLLHTFIKIKRNHIHRILAFIFPAIKKHLIKKLCSKNPNLRLFDMYKLLYLCKISTEE